MRVYNSRVRSAKYAGLAARSLLARSAPARPRVLPSLITTKGQAMSTAAEPADPPTDEEIEIEIAKDCDQIIQQQTRSAARRAMPPILAARP